MLNFSKRFYKSVYRYPYPGENTEFKPKKGLQITAVFTTLVGYLCYKQYKKTEASRLAFSQDYKPVNPEDLVPRMEDIKRVDEVKLKRAILEGDDFLVEELRKRLVRNPGEYAYVQVDGITDKDKFVKFVHRGIFDSMRSQGIDVKALQEEAQRKLNSIKLNKKE